MNKIINGKKYDTNTAKLIYETDESYGAWEEMYHKKTNEFFLVHWTCWEGQKDWIEPLDNETAKEYIAHECTADEYEDVFGLVEE